MLATAISRVEDNTSAAVNDAIRCQTERNVARCAAGGRAAIDHRLAELDQEWDVERYLETMAPSFTLLGLTLSLTTDRRWLLLPFVVQSFFLQHALQGWCPPLEILRRLGVRTMTEINAERYALKALRGDFEGLPGDARSALSAACAS